MILKVQKDELKDLNEENMELKSNLEKIKLDYENTEYQLCEIKINSDGLKEDIEGNNYKIDKLIAENNKLKSQNDICKNNMTRNELRALRETLFLKLQYDTLSKEVIAISEAKNNFEISLEKSNSDLAHLHNRFLEMQDQNEKLYNDYGELQEMYAKREKQIKNFEGLVTELQTKLQKYEELAVDENEELLKNYQLTII
ncbi:hypothetical protein NQ317_014051 [Molorchus minor]|uniref:Uncharacterized protein n=1 Tax=Molorchus minor TaxID=1323400 RepID=A0ABQ9JXE8_9CUCU|nr:hypothetical protein NQ317_014051 [Molorchus minor]